MSVPATEISTETPPIQATQASVDGVVWPPCNLDSDEPPLATYQHLQQLLLLIKCLDWLWQDRTDYFAAGNLTVYYSARKLKARDFKGPDFFVVLNTEKRPRKSWMVWEEDGKYPNIIVELLSDSTARNDRGPKKELYQDTFRTPDYFWFDPESFEFQGFHLVDGVYHAIAPTEQGWLWSEQLGLYLGVYEENLRFFTSEGELVQTPEEAATTAQEVALAAQEVAIAAQAEAEAERQRNEKLTAKLRELGIEPDAL